MKFEKARTKIPDCCRLNFHVGELNFEQHSENPAVMEAVSPLAKMKKQREQCDVVKQMSKSDIIVRSWVNDEMLAIWPELNNLLNTFPHSKYAKAQLRKFPPLKRLDIHKDGIDKNNKPKTDSQYDMFNRTLRIHIPLKTNPDSYIYCAGKFYSLAQGEVWMLNNFQAHTAANFSETEYRVHLILDLEPNLETMSLIDNAETDLGFESAELFQKL